MYNTKWSEYVILVDADHVDKVAFDLIVNFERMLERRIPQADMARWLECVALDGGVREGHHQIQVVLLHKQTKMENFIPGTMEELDGKAFSGELGEFQIIRYAKPCTKQTLTSTSPYSLCSPCRAASSARKYWATR